MGLRATGGRYLWRERWNGCHQAARTTIWENKTMSTPRRALILIDVQQQYFNGPFQIQYPPHQESLPMIARAIDAAAAAGIPIVAVQHSAGEGAPVFAPGTPEFELHPEIERRRTHAWKGVVKQYGSVYADTDLAGWLRQRDIDTVTLVGYMTNNCVLASAVEAELLGFHTEVLSDATGAINLANDAGFADAKTVHTTLLTLLNSNWAAVSTTDAWADALEAQQALKKSDLGSSAIAGMAHLTRA
jgi:nicotinamidase-related amidase